MNPIITAAAAAGVAEIDVIDRATVNSVDYDPPFGPIRLLVENAVPMVAASSGARLSNR